MTTQEEKINFYDVDVHLLEYIVNFLWSIKNKFCYYLPTNLVQLNVA